MIDSILVKRLKNGLKKTLNKIPLGGNKRKAGYKMSRLQIFNFEKNEVRTHIVNDEIYFFGKDVAGILGYSNTRKAIRDHVDEEDKLGERIVTAGQNREVTIINESGLYSLVLKSKLPNAKKFKRWVTKEVLPSIRKYGAYATPQQQYQIPTKLSEALRLAADLEEQNEQLQLANAELKPKALFADAVATSHTSILVGELAKILKQNGIDIGAKRLFDWLRDKGYLIKRRGTEWNMPTQKSMELKLFEVKETAVSRSDGSVSISKTAKVTGKGQQYFINKFLNHELKIM